MKTTPGTYIRRDCDHWETTAYVTHAHGFSPQEECQVPPKHRYNPLSHTFYARKTRQDLSFSQRRERRQIIWDVRACWLPYSCLRLSGGSCLNLQTSQSRVVSSMPKTSSLQMDHFSNHRTSFSTKLPGHIFRHGTNQSCQLVIIFSHQIKICPITGLNRPTGFQEVKAPRFLDIWHMKVVSCQPYAPGALKPRSIPALIFRGWVDPRAQGTVRCHGKIPGDTGNRSWDLPTCSAVP